MSNPHRNPTLTAKVAETLDEIADGRFVFGFGIGSSGDEMTAFGFEQDHIYSRFKEALDIILPLLRDGKTTHNGTFYSAQDLELRPRGPSAGTMPLLLGTRGPKAMRLAATHADIWSWFATESSQPEAFVEALADLDRACVDVGRDPNDIGRSLGVFVEPTEETGVAKWGLGEPIHGSTTEIADTLRRFADMGVTHLELWPWPQNLESLEALAPVLAELDAT